MDGASGLSVLLVIDGVGIGALPDAHLYGDEGANTLVNVARSTGGLRLPNLSRMGLGNIARIDGVDLVEDPTASWGRCAEASVGKDTLTGHWEMMGLESSVPFPTYPEGFPSDLLESFTRETGFGWIGGQPASGTQIIEELGNEHVSTGHPIVYTSADSVFQIAAHAKVIDPRALYELCALVRERVCVGQHAVARVIARPFAGPDSSGTYFRTVGRKDLSLPPSAPTALDALTDSGVHCTGIGKIAEMFSYRGITESIPVTDNSDALTKTTALITQGRRGFIFANLVDFDMHYGHRRDTPGFARALEMFDSDLARIMDVLHPNDLLIVTADHGCDPTTKSTDHTREYVPLLAQVKGLDEGTSLGTRSSFSDVGKTILDYHQVTNTLRGTSFLQEVLG